MIELIELPLKGAKLLKIKQFFDERGFFYEFYKKSAYHSLGISCEFVQDNISFSHYKTIRGMHFQRQPEQAKIVRAIQGKILDVIVDMRMDSPTFGHFEKVVLDSKENTQLFIPAGFAHGFAVLSSSAYLLYKLSSAYNPLEEKTFRYDDPTVAIDWPFQDPILSKRDQTAPSFQEVIAC
ncbi:MAG: dTDP-4-dehydrorhamnose 3,5-epimerase [Chlamydiae bacterium]|nr:dTDP-4-dehydrorhamnose 3,5-epimerase [Chlamydiota bacterium]